MMSRSFGFLFTLCFALGARAAIAGDVEFPTGSHIGLAPPPGMAASHSFPGFEDRDRKAGIIISQLPGPAYEQFLKSMNSGAIEVPGVANAKREILLTEGGAAHLVTGDQEADGVKFRKWLLITRRTVASSDVDLTFAFVVTAQVPVEAQSVYSEEIIRKSLGSITLRGLIPSAEILDKMPFKLNELAEFKGVRSILPGRALMLTESASAAEPPTDSSVMMVSIGTGAPSQVDERAQFSQNILRNIQGFSNLRLVSAEAMRVGGQPGYEIKLDGNSVPDNTEVTIVQWMRFSGGNYIRFVGVAPKTKWNESFARFRAVRDGVDPR